MHCRWIIRMVPAAGILLAGCGADEAIPSRESIERTGYYAQVDAIPLAEQAVEWAYAGHVGEMKKVLAKDATLINAVVGEYTPLTAALLNESGDMVDYLLNQGADPNLATSQGTPLEIAVSADVDIDIIDALKAHGAK